MRKLFQRDEKSPDVGLSRRLPCQSANHQCSGRIAFNFGTLMGSPVIGLVWRDAQLLHQLIDDETLS